MLLVILGDVCLLCYIDEFFAVIYFYCQSRVGHVGYKGGELFLIDNLVCYFPDELQNLKFNLSMLLEFSLN